MLAVLQFTLVLAVAVNAQAPITWLGSKNAKTIDSVGDELVTLYSGDQGLKSTQFLYQKNTDKSLNAPLVQVVLQNDASKQEFVMQTGFDMISQNCSCYWIDAKTTLTAAKFSTGQYAIIFRGKGVELKSGLFVLSAVGPSSIVTKPQTPTIDNKGTAEVKGRSRSAAGKIETSSSQALLVAMIFGVLAF